MNKLLVVMPNRLMYMSAKRIIDEAGIDATVIETTSVRVLEDVAREMENNTGIVVARGNQAQILKKSALYPVAEIIFTGQEMALFIHEALKKAGHENPRIAFIGFRHMYSDIENLALLGNADVQLFYAASSQDVVPTVDRALSAGFEVIIGSENACRYAESIGVKTVFIDHSDVCIRDAIRRALFSLNAMRIEQQKTAEFMSLLNYSFDAILRLSNEGVIEIANIIAEKAFKPVTDSLIGQKFTEIPHLELPDSVYAALEQHHSLFSHVICVKKERYLLNIACVDAEGKHMGFILSLYAFGSVDNLEEKIRQERIQQGNIAHRRFNDFTTHSPRMKRLLSDAEMYAQYDVPILITGEEGTEKTRLAECIHNGSLRKSAPYIQADLSALPLSHQTELLFGDAKNNGIVYSAHKGTLYIRNAHLLTEESQHQLMNVIRYERYYTGTQHISTWASVRIICSTSENLLALARNGRFLFSLAEKLSDYELHIPPLRECPEDIPMLISANTTFARIRTHKQAVFTPGAIELMMQYPWPGNQRSMASFFERAFLLARDNRIDSAFIAEYLLKSRDEQTPASLLVVSSEEERELRSALEAYHGNKSAVVNALGISRATLYRRMKKYGIAP